MTQSSCWKYSTRYALGLPMQVCQSAKVGLSWTLGQKMPLPAASPGPCALQKLPAAPKNNCPCFSSMFNQQQQVNHKTHSKIARLTRPQTWQNPRTLPTRPSWLGVIGKSNSYVKRRWGLSEQVSCFSGRGVKSGSQLANTR